MMVLALEQPLEVQTATEKQCEITDDQNSPEQSFVHSLSTCAQVVRRKLRSKLEAAANEKVLASGRPLEPQIVSEPRWKSNQKLDPYKVRPGAYKMVLPPEEEAKLQLVRAPPEVLLTSLSTTALGDMWHNAGSCAHLAWELLYSTR